MGEFLFSNEIGIAYHEFPDSFQKTHDDRLFKHVTFQETNSDVQLRVHPVDHNWQTLEGSQQKSVILSDTNWDPLTDKLRIKTVLSVDIEGVQESFWLHQHQINYTEAQSLNQYRIRGVDPSGIKSDWVYSKLRDEDNDLVVYELLHDLLNVLMQTKEEDLEVALEAYTEDVLTHIFLNQLPQEKALSYQSIQELQYATSIDAQEAYDILQQLNKMTKEEKQTKISELSSIIGNIMKKSIIDTFTSSPEELFTFAKVYKLFDHVNMKKDDFLATFIEYYLEEQMDSIVKQTNLEVFLQNDEKLTLLLQSAFAFDVQHELISHAYQITFNDRFVTLIQDTVKLFTEPFVYEALTSEQNEEISQFLRMAIQELYLPCRILEERGALIETDLFDQHHQEPASDVVEYDTILHDSNTNEIYTMKQLLLKDLFEFVVEQEEATDDVYAYLLDHILNMINFPNISLYLDYHPVEFLEIVANIKESFTHAYQTWKALYSKSITVNLKEAQSLKPLYNSDSIQKAYQIKTKEIYAIEKEKKNEKQQETIYSILQELHESQNQAIHYKQEAFLSTAWNEKSEINSVKKQHDAQNEKVNIQCNSSSQINSYKKTFIKNATTYLALHDLLNYVDQKKQKIIYEHDHLDMSFLYMVIFQQQPKDSMQNIWNESQEIDIDADRQDSFYTSIYTQLQEKIDVVLGDLGEGWPLGVFVLGENTLEGDENNPYSHQDDENLDNTW